MSTLCVNIDHVATIRQARQGKEPDPVMAAMIVERAGSTGVTMHLREDRRHVQSRDVRLVHEVVQGHMNLEMATAEMGTAIEIKPDIVTLVPERREEITTEGGLNVMADIAKIRRAVSTLQDSGIRVSLFIDADHQQIKASAECGVNEIELHTGPWANTQNETDQGLEWDKLAKSTRFGLDLGLIVNAGHGLNYHNVGPVAAIPNISELNIGHSIISQSVFDGLGKATRQMARLIAEATHHPHTYRFDTT